MTSSSILGFVAAVHLLLMGLVWFQPVGLGAQEPIVPRDWILVQVDHIQFSVPADLKQQNVVGRDSDFWHFRNDRIWLDIERGIHAEVSDIYRKNTDYVERSTRINGKVARLYSFRLDDSTLSRMGENLVFVVAVTFENLDKPKNRLTLWAYCKGPGEQELAKKIFSSVKFRRG
jgi:hypothetical protein